MRETEKEFIAAAKKHREEGPSIPIEELLIKLCHVYYRETGRSLPGIKLDERSFHSLAAVMPHRFIAGDITRLELYGPWGPLEVTLDY